MKTRTREVKDQLEEILEKNRDAEKGYKKAADNTDDANLQRYFTKKAKDRAQFNTELHRQMATEYDDFDGDGSFTGDIHRAWMDIKSFFSGDDGEAMLEESIRGDKAAVEEYKDILDDNNLPVSIAKLIRKQKGDIESDLSQNKSIEDIRS